MGRFPADFRQISGKLSGNLPAPHGQIPGKPSGAPLAGLRQTFRQTLRCPMGRSPANTPAPCRNPPTNSPATLRRPVGRSPTNPPVPCWNPPTNPPAPLPNKHPACLKNTMLRSNVVAAGPESGRGNALFIPFIIGGSCPDGGFGSPEWLIRVGKGLNMLFLRSKMLFLLTVRNLLLFL